MRALLLLLVVCSGCASPARSLALGSALLAGVGTVDRKPGTCFTACTPGTVCNGETGFCEAMRCHGRCGRDEVCVNDGQLSEQCVPR